jgi:hypothetical protein
MQRLRGVLQHGISGLVGVTRPTSRFEHSIGVMILVSHLGASLEEQIAALLHDVSHTAFSHVVDYVFDGHDSQSYHEEQKEGWIARSDLPDVLGRFGYNWQDFLHEEGFRLLEQPAPALCADRLDYCLRDSRDLGIATDDEVQRALSHLVVAGQRIIMDDLAAARWLADTYIAADDASWANFREVGLYELTAQAIRTAFRLGVFTEEDLWGTDATAWARLNACSDGELQAQLRLVSKDTRFVWDEAAPTFRVSTKLRTIDPHVLIDGQVRLLSEADSDFALRRQAYLSRKAGKWPVRVIGPGA